ncbi:hypothetical protein [Inquilinus limosus]|uniref:hypothetical protein n=1 Tax=Inquilinus limosus TaxID=171674 RepID=UPI00041F36FC|nr:hypothetical protein [Inquilinus limosus]
MAMERAEAMQLQALAAIKANDTDRARTLELALDRLDRGVRRTLAIKAHLAQKRREAADKAAAEARARGEAKSRRRQQVQRLVAWSMAAADGDMEADDVVYVSAAVLGRMLYDPEIDAALDLAEHPIEEIVIRLCREMNIRPELVLPCFDPSGPFKTMDEIWDEGGPQPRRRYPPGYSSPAWEAAAPGAEAPLGPSES